MAIIADRGEVFSLLLFPTPRMWSSNARPSRGLICAQRKLRRSSPPSPPRPVPSGPRRPSLTIRARLFHGLGPPCSRFSSSLSLSLYRETINKIYAGGVYPAARSLPPSFPRARGQSAEEGVKVVLPNGGARNSRGERMGRAGRGWRRSKRNNIVNSIRTRGMRLPALPRFHPARDPKIYANRVACGRLIPGKNK